MRSKAVVFGAVSIVNAIASGRGATVSVDLRTEATVDLSAKPGEFAVRVNGAARKSTLAAEAARTAIKKAGLDPSGYSGSIETTSDAPIGVGLKTSSSSSLAVAMATFSCLGRDVISDTVLQCSVEASLASGASITGALDDASSCLLGGINHADNLARVMVRSELLKEALTVVILVPAEGSNRATVKPEFARKLSKVTDEAFKMSMAGNMWDAMTLNGLVYSSIYGYDPSPALDAINLGALGSGLSGTGPAVAAVFGPGQEDALDNLRKEWSMHGGRVITTPTNNKHGWSEAIG